ncbi:MAG: ATP-binding protein [Alphaproteobacteria bacterium]
MNDTGRKETEPEVTRLQSRLARERATRTQVESIAEKTIRDLYDRQQQLRLLEEIARAANQSAAMHDTLHFVLARVCAFSNWEVGHCYLTEGEAGNVRLCSARLWHAADKNKIAAFLRRSEEIEFVSGIGLPGRVLASGKPAWIVDVTLDSNFPRAPIARLCGLKAAAAFPMHSGDEIVGVLEFFASEAREPDATLLDIMAHAGVQLGRVIERQRAQQKLLVQADELKRARDEARDADRAKSVFLSNMSHELRTPLNAILGFSQMIRDEMLGPLDAKYRAYAQDIHESGRHLMSILNDILDMSKVEAGRMELRNEPVCMAEIVAACKRIIAPTAEANGVTLAFDLPQMLPLLRSDQVRLKQILLNLISNAVKFTPREGNVTVSIRVEPEGVIIVVADTGIGMNETEIALALQPFRQIDNRLNRRFEGTGLGLPLTKAMVKLHGGTLAIESTPGGGTNVRITLPAERIISMGGHPARAAS